MAVRSRDKVALVSLGIILAFVASLYRTSREEISPQEAWKACDRNINKILAPAIFRYSIDHANSLPKSLSLLVPKYLDAVPQCPAAGIDGYLKGYAVQNDGNYSLFCKGHPGFKTPPHLIIHLERSLDF